jgi:hypothetical protein
VLEIVYRRDSVKPQQQPQTETAKSRHPSIQLSSDNLRDMQQLAGAGFNGSVSDAINWTLADWMAGGGDIMLDAMQQENAKPRSKTSAEA